MGYMRHHAILVTGEEWTSDIEDVKNTKEARSAAVQIFGGPSAVSPLSKAAMNGTRSFAIFPDGSKEGWDESDAGDKRRDAFVAWLREHTTYSDGSCIVDWVEVQYGDDNREICVTRHSDDAARIQKGA